jgi:hypothetical protein
MRKDVNNYMTVNATIGMSRLLFEDLKTDGLLTRRVQLLNR